MGFFCQNCKSSILSSWIVSVILKSVSDDLNICSSPAPTYWSVSVGFLSYCRISSCAWWVLIMCRTWICNNAVEIIWSPVWYFLYVYFSQVPGNMLAQGKFSPGSRTEMIWDWAARATSKQSLFTPCEGLFTCSPPLFLGCRFLGSQPRVAGGYQGSPLAYPWPPASVPWACGLLMLLCVPPAFQVSIVWTVAYFNSQAA